MPQANDAASMFRSLSPDKQREYFERLSPEEKTNLHNALTSAAVPVSVPPAPKEGFLGELGKQNVALGQGLKSFVTMTPEDKGSPSARDSRILSTLGHGVYETLAAPLRELAGRTQPGRSVLTKSPGLLKAPVDALGGAVSAALGGDPAAARAHAMAGDKGAEWADLVGVPAETALVGGLLRKLLPTHLPPNPKAASLLTKAAGATENQAIEFPREFSIALPELNATPPKIPFDKMTVRDLYTHVNDTFGRLENDFNNKLSVIARQDIVPQSVATEIRSYKIAHPILPEDFEWNSKLDSRAVLFEKPHSYGDLNIQRMRARDRIGDFYKQFPSTQGSKMGSNVNIVLDTAIHDATKNLIYNTLEQTYAGQTPPNYFRDLKRTESALYNIKDQLGQRTKKLANMGARTFLDRTRVHSYMSGTGHVGAAIGGVTEAIFPEVRSANKAVRKALAPRTSRLVAPATVAPVVARRASPSLAPAPLAPRQNETDAWQTPLP